MLESVDSFLDRSGADEGTMVAAWYDAGDGWELYFGFFTTALWEEQEFTPTETTRVSVSHVPVEALRSLVPEERMPQSVSGSVTVACDDEEDHISYEFSSDVRLQYRRSQEMEEWGHTFPALCIEHWIKSRDMADIAAEHEAAMLDVLDNLGVELEENDAYTGTFVVAFEDPRCRVTYNESGEALLDRWRDDDTRLSEGELLDVVDGWTVHLDGLDPDVVDVSLRREEFGELLYETDVGLTADTQVSREQALEAAREHEQPSMVTVNTDDGVERYRLPSIEAPGASDVIVRVTQDGVLLDERRLPVMREIGLDVTVGGPGSSEGGQMEPPTLYAEPSHTVGRQTWDTHLSMGVADERETWVIDDDDDFDAVMEVILDSLTGTVKLSEPYLVPEILEEFIQEGADDLDLWVALGHNESYMSDFRADFEDCVDLADSLGKDVHLLWVPKDPGSPLHDRFLLNEETGLMIGTSFNSLDSNLTMVTEIGDDHAQDLEQNFDHWWVNSRFRHTLDVEVIGTTSSRGS